ncbi:MAG: TonB-dependent receptor [Rikenellaceae bacterium]|nr:TonB-dependent receptor [Rikenellaceae bacterium]
MKKTATLICFILIFFAAFAQVKNETEITVNNITLDSLRRVVNERTAFELFYRLESPADTFKVSLSFSDNSLQRRLEGALAGTGYTVTVVDNNIYLLKNVGIFLSLPEGYFFDKNKSGASSDYLGAVTYSDNVARFDNKVYKIGDPNSPKGSGRAVLTGYVTNIDTGEPIPGASVFIAAPNTATTTDAFGFYRILLPPGQNTLEIRGYGLEDAKLTLEVFGDGDLNILAKDKVYPLKGIVLTAESTQKMRSTQIGLERVRIDRIKHVPAAFGEADVMKIVLTLPGVKSVGESSGGFNVRGGATDQNLILFNEGTLYNPTHLFGLFSAFNPDVVSDIELYKSTIPAKYGGRISSVLEINSRNGNSNKITGSAGIGLLTGKVHVEGPIVKDKTNFIFGARTTYSNWILKLLPEESGYNNGTASFQDFSLGLNHKIDSRNTVYLYGYYSGDGFKFNPDTTYNYSNMNWSVKWRNIINDRHNLVVSAGYDQYNYESEEKGNQVNAYNMKFDIRQAFLKANFNWLKNERHSVNYGVNSVFYNLAPGTLAPASGESLVVARTLEKERAAEVSLYISDSWNIADRLSIDLGLRYTFYSAFGPKNWYKYGNEIRDESSITDTVFTPAGSMVKPYHYPEFRISARYSLTDNLSFKAGFNSMKQYIHMLSNTSSVSPTDIWKLSDANIEPQNGWQAAGGLYSNIFGSKVELSVEGYYKKMNNYLDYKSGAILNMNESIERDVLKTTGRAYGIEVLAKKPLGKLNGWLSYTYSRTQLRGSGEKESYSVNGGDWYNAAYDKPHDIKLIGNYKFTQRFSISFNMDYSTGRPVTIPIAKYYYGDGYRLYYSERNAYRIPDYFRMDFSINIEPSHNLTLFTYSTITIGVYNVTGRKNAFSVYYDTNSGRKIQGYKLSIFGAPIPYITYNIKF